MTCYVAQVNELQSVVSVVVAELYLISCFEAVCFVRMAEGLYYHTFDLIKMADCTLQRQVSKTDTLVKSKINISDDGK